VQECRICAIKARATDQNLAFSPKAFFLSTVVTPAAVSDQLQSTHSPARKPYVRPHGCRETGLFETAGEDDSHSHSCGARPNFTTSHDTRWPYLTFSWRISARQWNGLFSCCRREGVRLRIRRALLEMIGQRGSRLSPVVSSRARKHISENRSALQDPLRTQESAPSKSSTSSSKLLTIQAERLDGFHTTVISRTVVLWCCGPDGWWKATRRRSTQSAWYGR